MKNYLFVCVAISIGAGEACPSEAAEARLDKQRQSQILQRYLAAVEILSNQQAGLRGKATMSEVIESQYEKAGEKKQKTQNSEYEFVIKGDKYKVTRQLTMSQEEADSAYKPVSSPGTAPPKDVTRSIMTMTIGNGNDVSQAVKGPRDSNYSLMARENAQSTRSSLSLIEMHKIARSCFSLDMYYVPTLLEGNSKHIDSVSEIKEDGNVHYKVFFHKEEMAKTLVDGWWIVDPSLGWVATEFHVEEHRTGKDHKVSRLIVGKNTFKKGATIVLPVGTEIVNKHTSELRPDPASTKLAKMTAEKGALITVRTTKIDCEAFELGAVGDSEFTFGSVGLGYADLPAGKPRNYTVLILVATSVVTLLGGIWLRLRQRKQLAS